MVTSKEEAKKFTCNPNFSRFTLYHKRLAAIHMKRKEVVLNKPRYAGFTVLELRKLHMYDFHYNYVKPMYGDRAKLLFTDTDSLMYEIETKDSYRDILPDVREKFDTSNYTQKITHLELRWMLTRRSLGCSRMKLVDCKSLSLLV